MFLNGGYLGSAIVFPQPTESTNRRPKGPLSEKVPSRKRYFFFKKIFFQQWP